MEDIALVAPPSAPPTAAPIGPPTEAPAAAPVDAPDKADPATEVFPSDCGSKAPTILPAIPTAPVIPETIPGDIPAFGLGAGTSVSGTLASGIFANVLVSMGALGSNPLAFIKSNPFSNLCFTSFLLPCIDTFWCPGVLANSPEACPKASHFL